MSTAFNTNPSYLSSRLFHPDKPRIGASTYLNVNLLPDFLEYIKTNLAPEQLIALSEYQLQTYLMELSIREKVTESLESFTSKIIGHIRQRKQFWTNSKIVKSKENEEKQKEEEEHQHEAIRQYAKDVEYIKQKIGQSLDKQFRNQKKRIIPQFCGQFVQQFGFKDKQCLKLSWTNYCLMPAYVLKQYIKSILSNRLQGDEPVSSYVLPAYELLSLQNKNLLKSLQNVVQYFLSHQRTRSQKYQSRRPEFNRQRRLPSYLAQQNCQYPQNNRHEIEEEVSVSCQSQLHLDQVHQHLSVRENNQPANVIEQQQKVNIDHKQNRNQEQISEEQSSSQEEQNEFYHDFTSEVATKEFYDSKTFAKQVTINQCHNLLQILRCLAYSLNGMQTQWFELRWKQVEELKIMSEKKRKQEQAEEESEEDSQSEKQQNKQKSKQDKGQEKKQTIKQVLQENDLPENSQNPQNSQPILQENEHNEEEKNPNIEQNNQNPTSKQSIDFNQQNIQQEQNPQSSSSSQPNENPPSPSDNPQPIQIGIRKPIFDLQWQNPKCFSFTKLTRHLSQKLFSMRQVYFIVQQYLKRQIPVQYQNQSRYFRQIENQSVTLETALVDPSTNIEEILEEFNQMIYDPQHVKLSSFKTQGISIPWSESQYLLFLQGLKEYFFIPTNNRKISLFMSSKSLSKSSIQANHVKHVKALYLKNMQLRIDKGECGGGKKGRMLGKLQFIQKDCENFSMKYFDKIKKNKKSKIKRRRIGGEDQDDAAEQIDSAY